MVHRGGASNPQGMTSDAVGVLADANGTHPQVLLQEGACEGAPVTEPEEGEVPLSPSEPLRKVLPELLYGADWATDTACAVLVAHTAEAQLVCLARPDHEHELFGFSKAATLVGLSYFKVYSS